METNRDVAGFEAAFDPQIARLLDRAQESASIVDRLMAIPGGEAGTAASEWDRAIAQRLERKLAATVRDLIETKAERRSA